jgi:ribosomal peptide maturation radical SAM protein 1
MVAGIAMVEPQTYSQPVLIDTIRRASAGADCVIVVPPFASLLRPSLGPHILQMVARGEGVRVRIVYANIVFAHLVGSENYEPICETVFATSYDSPRRQLGLLGKRIFARLAHGLQPLGLPSKRLHSTSSSLTELHRMERCTDRWCDIVSTGILEAGCSVVGITSSFEQTNAGVALLRSLKAKKREVLTLVGGANCEGTMAEAMLELGPDIIDVVFAGEAEALFPHILKRALYNGALPQRIVAAAPCVEMDSIPTPDFADYFAHLRTLLPDFDLTRCWLAYETSRGCWWGEKHHCTFCGLNGRTMAFRQKSSAKVLADLKKLLCESPTRSVTMTDNIMPYAYHKTLIPELRKAELPVRIFYEQKANLTLDQVKNLRDAGISVIQPGIEALTTPLLRLMDKGVSAKRNVSLLRYCRAVELVVAWNLLSEFPGDSALDFQDTLQMVPLLRHLSPPTGVSPLSIDRFSPYFESSSRYGIMNIRPWSAYSDVFPEDADIASLAYHFDGDYRSGSRESPDLLSALDKEVAEWRGAWEGDDKPPPVLMVAQLTKDMFYLVDTRFERGPRIKFLDVDHTRATLVEGSLQDRYCGWAINEGFAVALDGRSVPLATTSYELLKKFESQLEYS